MDKEKSHDEGSMRPLTTRQRLDTIMITAAALGMSVPNPFMSDCVKSQIPEKPCLNCGEMKRHNNSFCSAKYCSVYRERKRSETR